MVQSCGTGWCIGSTHQRHFGRTKCSLQDGAAPAALVWVVRAVDTPLVAVHPEPFVPLVLPVPLHFRHGHGSKNLPLFSNTTENRDDHIKRRFYPCTDTLKILKSRKWIVHVTDPATKTSTSIGPCVAIHVVPYGLTPRGNRSWYKNVYFYKTVYSAATYSAAKKYISIGSCIVIYAIPYRLTTRGNRSCYRNVYMDRTVYRENHVVP